MMAFITVSLLLVFFILLLISTPWRVEAATRITYLAGSSREAIGCVACKYKHADTKRIKSKS